MLAVRTFPRLKLQGRYFGFGWAMAIWLLVVGHALAAPEFDDRGRSGSTIPVPAPGTIWWWTTRQEEVELQAAAHREGATQALESWRHAVATADEAARREQSALGRHVALATSLLRQDQRQRELGLIATAAEGEVTAAMAVLSRTAWRASVERRNMPRVGPLLALVAGMAADLRMHRLELLDESARRAHALQAVATEVEMLDLARAAAVATTVDAKAALREAQLGWLEAEGRRAAVGRQLAAIEAAVSRAEAMALPPPVPIGRGGDHKREIDPELRLLGGLLRLADETARMAGARPRRRFGAASGAGPWLWHVSGLAVFAPIAGRLRPAHVSSAGTGAPGFWIESVTTQTVSSPLSGQVVFAAPFRGLGRLLIIDCGKGYHVLLSGLTQLDVDRGASVVAGQAIGEIVAARKRSTRLYVELRHRGVPVEPDSWQVAREGKVRS